MRKTFFRLLGWWGPLLLVMTLSMKAGEFSEHFKKSSLDPSVWSSDFHPGCLGVDYVVDEQGLLLRGLKSPSGKSGTMAYLERDANFVSDDFSLKASLVFLNKTESKGKILDLVLCTMNGERLVSAEFSREGTGQVRISGMPSHHGAAKMIQTVQTLSSFPAQIELGVNRTGENYLLTVNGKDFCRFDGDTAEVATLRLVVYEARENILVKSLEMKELTE